MRASIAAEADAPENIALFVSHRVDLDSATVGNPLYIDMRCGAVYDQRENCSLPGDDTGDTISRLQPHFSEFTVQYWAWKNCDADYIGLCHYRRYLSFSPRRMKTGNYHFVEEPTFGRHMERKHRLTDPVRMREIIHRYDGIIAQEIPLTEIRTPMGTQASVRKLWDLRVGEYFEQSIFDLLLRLIEQTAPEYGEAARGYFASDRYRGFNCFILRRELFDRLCRFQFPILFELEKRMDFTGYSGNMLRAPAYAGEMLNGIFLYHLLRYEHWNLNQRQLVQVEYSDRITSPLTPFFRYILSYSERMAKWILKPFFPPGSRGRAQIKKLYCKMNRRGKATRP